MPTSATGAKSLIGSNGSLALKIGAVTCVVVCRDAEHVAVRRALCDDVRADDAARAGAIFRDDRLADPLAELLPDQSRHHVGGGTRRQRHHKAQRMIGPFAWRGLRVDRACAEHHRRDHQGCAHGSHPLILFVPLVWT